MAKRKKNIARDLERVFGTPVVLESCAPVRDPRKLLEHGLVTMVRVSQSPDLEYAMQAGRWLVDYATRILERQGQQQKPKADERVQIIAELKGLYAKALNPNPLVSDATIDLIPES